MLDFMTVNLAGGTINKYCRRDRISHYPWKMNPYGTGEFFSFLLQLKNGAEQPGIGSSEYAL